MKNERICIGIVGAGVMGVGVAIRFALHDYYICLLDKDESILNKAKAEIQKQLRIMNMFQKNIEEEKVMKNMEFTVTYQDFGNMEYIVENVPEKLDIKKDIYIELEKVCKEECIYMINTSCIPITQIGAFTNRVDKVVGVHFMNPVPMKNFAEVIKGYYTSEDTIQSIGTLLENVGISIEIVNDSAGFVSNRLSHLFMNEAAYLVYEGVAKAEQIDQIFKQGFGHKMGPLETADLIGISTVLDSLKILYEYYEDPKFRACPLLKQMVSAGMIGRKNGKGFYNY